MTTAADEIVWISVARAARILDVHRRTVIRYIEKGWLPTTRRLGGVGWYDVPYDDVMKLLARSTKIEAVEDSL